MSTSGISTGSNNSSQGSNVSRRRGRNAAALRRVGALNEFDDGDLDYDDDISDRLSNADSGISESISTYSLGVGKHVDVKQKLVTILYGIFVVTGIITIAVACHYYPSKRFIAAQKAAKEAAAKAKAVSEETGKAVIEEAGKKAPVDWRTHVDGLTSKVRIMSDSDIAYNKDGPMYLIIAGHVIDVTSGKSMYGEGTGYHGFIGRDGTLAFFTGKFDDEGFTSDLGKIEPDMAKAISGWINFYLNHESYKFVGLHKGRFFDNNAKPTKQLEALRKELEIAEGLDEIQTKLEQQFPSCNSEWNAETGSKLSCSTSSGGVERNLAGVPRMFEDGNKKGVRCACVQSEDLDDPRVKEYKDCAKDSAECRLKE